MEYKGLKEDEDNFIFHCPKCDTWEKVPRRELLNYTEEEF